MTERMGANTPQPTRFDEGPRLRHSATQASRLVAAMGAAWLVVFWLAAPAQHKLVVILNGLSTWGVHAASALLTARMINDSEALATHVRHHRPQVLSRWRMDQGAATLKRSAGALAWLLLAFIPYALGCYGTVAIWARQLATGLLRDGVSLDLLMNSAMGLFIPLISVFFTAVFLSNAFDEYYAMRVVRAEVRLVHEARDAQAGELYEVREVAAGHGELSLHDDVERSA